MRAEPNISATVRTTCPYCGVGCGVLASPGGDGSVAIAGDPHHPANWGRLCSKGSALGETLALDERLLAPRIHGRDAEWDEALDLVAQNFSRAIAEHGPDSVAFYVSGQLLTEDYYVANKLMKGFLGSANIDTNSRLCMSSSVAGHVRAFGSDTVPGTYEDLEEADLVVLVGSNLAWCHPVLYQRLCAAKAARPEMKVVLVDPRRTATADLCDLHLALAPDADVALFSGLLAHLADTGCVDEDFVAEHTEGYGKALEAARQWDIPRLLARSGLPEADIRAFFALFAGSEKVVTVYSQGVNQSAEGTDKVNAIINCHLACGRIGRPGTGPFSVTGQPNAMGGREVGGLANMLAAHMAIENPDHRALVQDFWQSPAIPEKPGLKAVDLFRAVGEGRIKALWIMGTNPVVSMPEADSVKAAIENCPFVVVSDVMARTDTLDLAHVALPAAAWGEKNGTVTNSERRISRQRPFLPLPGQARPDWWIVTQLARRMGFGAAFAYRNAAEIFAEHARLSATENAGQRDFDLSGLADLDAESYETLAPVQWPLRADGSTQTRFFADGGFFRPNGRALFVVPRVAGPAVPKPGFVLNSGRVRDQWHTMTRTGLSARLSAHVPEPYVEIHAEDAARLDFRGGDIARLSSAHGEVLLRCRVTRDVAPGSVFAPMHWNARFASKGRIGAAIEARVDPVSGQPALKASRVAVEPYPAAWHGFAVCRERPPGDLADYAAIARTDGGWRVELADAGPCNADALMRRLLACEIAEPFAKYRDEAAGAHRLAAFDGERLSAALWVAPKPLPVSRSFAAAQLASPRLTALDRMRLLAGRGRADRPDPGRIVCSCLQVGVNDIARAAAKGAGTVAAIGEATKAGTNCGSCRAEIAALLASRPLAAATIGTIA
ncbi:nitrate reductase [Aureimonas psammosilenae]|uniref:nitrate reductase n=1 Tax=Aureimonas psammosilenae TaxID=2495496 RepID=UPI001260CEB6|nr:nitrate reductase [Aureimonas psammosilenae]